MRLSANQTPTPYFIAEHVFKFNILLSSDIVEPSRRELILNVFFLKTI